MRTRVQRWGGSLALRIPDSLASETALESGSEVEVTMNEGRLIVTPLKPPVYALDDLLNHVTSENIHREVETDGRIGDEAW